MLSSGSGAGGGNFGRMQSATIIVVSLGMVVIVDCCGRGKVLSTIMVGAGSGAGGTDPVVARLEMRASGDSGNCAGCCRLWVAHFGCWHGAGFSSTSRS